jgi:hypothetical protein
MVICGGFFSKSNFVPRKQIMAFSVFAQVIVKKERSVFFLL